jgi:dTDP-4-dehydrorhamnose reductase
LAQANGLILIYVSTAGIFDGSKQSYDDWDTPNPLGVYGRSKYIGETIVERRVQKHLICRAGWMMGGGPGKDKKFIGKLMKQIAAGVRKLNIVDDKTGSPTYAIDFARNVEMVLLEGKYGLFNMVGRGEASRLDIARELIRLIGLAEKVDVVPVPSEFFSREYFAWRPKSERLINYKLDLLGLNKMRDWPAALSEYLNDYYKDHLRGLVVGRAG